MKPMIYCELCGDDLSTEEIESPRTDRNGDILCDRCFGDRYTHLCPVCENLFDERFDEKISPKHLLILPSVGKDLCVDPGIYKIIKYPFFRDGLIEFDLIASSINRISNVPKDPEILSAPNRLHYICDECAHI